MTPSLPVSPVSPLTILHVPNLYPHFMPWNVCSHFSSFLVCLSLHCFLYLGHLLLAYKRDFVISIRFSQHVTPVNKPSPNLLFLKIFNWRINNHLRVLYSSFPLAICFTSGNVYVSICPTYSLNLSYPLLLPLCTKVCYLCLHLCSCPANRFISTIFLDSVYRY